MGERVRARVALIGLDLRVLRSVRHQWFRNMGGDTKLHKATQQYVSTAAD